MSIPTPNPSQDKTQERRAFIIAIIFLLAIFANLVLSLSQGFQTGAWQHFARAGFVVLFGVAIVVALMWIRRGKAEKGIWLIIRSFLFTLIATSFLLEGFGLILALIELVLAGTVTFFALPEEKRNRSFIAIIIAALLTFGLDLLPLNYRIPAPAALKSALPIIAAMVVIALFIIAWQTLRWRSVRAKLIIPTLFFVSLVVAAIVAYNTVLSVRQFDAAEEERLETMHDIFNARITSEENFASALAIEAAQNPDIQKAFAEQDREQLLELTLPGYEELNTHFDVPFYQYHLPPAISFLRVHKPEAYGDDLSAFRKTVLAVNEDKTTIQGIEVGRRGYAIRGLSPVTYKGEHVGSVEYGLNFGQTLINTLKEKFKFDFQLTISRDTAKIADFVASSEYEDVQNDQILVTASTLEEPFLAPEENYTNALAGKTTIEHLTNANVEYAILTMPIIDFSGKVVGTLDIISDHTAIVQAQKRQILTAIGLLLGTLLVIGISFYWISNRTLAPITTLTTAANALAAGDFTKSVEVESEDELGTLATAFNTMAQEIRENVETLEKRVAERTHNQAVVAEIATEIAEIQEMDNMLTQMVHLTQRGFNLYYAHVFIFREESQGEELKIIACGYREGDEHEGTHGTSTINYNNENSIVARCARERKPVIVNDVRNSSEWLPNPLLPETRAEMAIPLLVGDQLLGVLDIQADTIDRFTQEDITVQSTLAAQIAVAMQNLMRYEESQKIASDLSVVAEVGIATATETDAERLLQNIVDLSKQSFQLYHAHIYLLNKSGDTLQLNTGAGDVGRKMVAEGLSIPLDSKKSIVARAARTQQGVTVNDVTEDPSFLPNPLLPETRSEMAVPMIVGDKVIGVLDVQSARIGRFTELDIDIQTTLASQIAVALQNARSFENAQKEAEREATINQISQKIQQADTIEKAMQVAARELGHALGKRQTMVVIDPNALRREQE